MPGQKTRPSDNKKRELMDYKVKINENEKTDKCL